MFAFAIFDGDDFMLARDPIGIKPLYYGYTGRPLFYLGTGRHELAGVDEVHEFPAGHYYTPKEGFVPYIPVPEIQDHLLTDIEETARSSGRPLSMR